MNDELKVYNEGAQYVIDLNDALQKEAERLRMHSIVVAPAVYEELADLLKDGCDRGGLFCYGREGEYIPVTEMVSFFREELTNFAKVLQDETETSLREFFLGISDEQVAAILRARHHVGKELREALAATEKTDFDCDDEKTPTALE